MSSRRSRSGGNAKREDGEAVVEVRAEAPGLRPRRARSRLVAATMRTSTRTRAVAADALELALLQHAQELRLQLERELADLVEEERAAVGELEAPVRRCSRAGEGALLVAEELALDERRRERRAVDRDERPAAARARLVDRARDELLAGAGLAEEQHGRRRRRDLAELAEDRRAARRRAPTSSSAPSRSSASWRR